MVVTGNGNDQCSIRKRYTKNLESWEISKQCEQRFLKNKTTKNKINDYKDLKDIQNTSYSKTKKSNYNNDKK